MISDLGRLIRTFKKMNISGFDITTNLKWGFFFLDMNKDRLLAVFDELQGSGYNLESMEEKEGGLWQLYVTKVEILTPEKLHKRNLAFNELAEHCSVQIYDGWDVERVEA